MVVLLLPLCMKTATERRVVYFHYLKKMYPKLQENSISWVGGSIIFKKEAILLQEISKRFFLSVWYGSGLVHISNIARARVPSVATVFEVGEQVKVMAIKSPSPTKYAFR